MKARYSLVIALVVCGSAQAGPALDPAPWQPARAGTEMTWRNVDGGERGRGVIGTADGYEVNWTWEGDESSGYMFCSYCGSTHFDESAYAELWPLEVGKSVAFWRNSGGNKWKDRIEVVDTDTYELKRGPVDVYVVKWTSTAYSHSWKGETTTLFAPGIGWSVRFDHQDNQGESWGWRAVSFSR